MTGLSYIYALLNTVIYLEPITDAYVPTAAFACVWTHTYCRRSLRARSSGMDRVWFGSQVFFFASAFNANIGDWNTAAVTTLDSVCAAFGRRHATAADALGRCSIRRGRCARRHRRCARAHECARTHL
jgi:hypothetical protein